MNLPKSVDDPSLLHHEPLRNHIALVKAAKDVSRSATRQVVSQFVDAMRDNDKVRTRNVSVRSKISTTLL